MCKIFTARFRRTRGLAVTFLLSVFLRPFLSWCHREEEEGEEERGGAIVGRRGREGEGWCHREEEEGEGERSVAALV